MGSLGSEVDGTDGVRTNMKNKLREGSVSMQAE